MAGAGAVVLLVALGAVWGTGWGFNLFAPGAALLAAALAGLVTTKGIVTWDEQRFRERERSGYSHREKEYEQIVSIMIARFLSGKYDMARDSELRARAAVWAGPEVIRELGSWQHEIGRIISAGTTDGNGQVLLTAGQGARLKQIVASVVIAMRQDLETVGEQTDINASEVVASIFND